MNVMRSIEKENRIGRGGWLFSFPCLCCLVLCFGVLFSCVFAWAQKGIEDEKELAPKTQGLRLVIVPEKNAFILREQYKPVVDFLARKIGRNIYLEVSPDYISAVHALVDQEADAAFLSSYSYLLARQQAAVEPLVRPLWPVAKNVCRSYILTRTNSDIREFTDMKDKRLAVVDENSFAGFIFAACLFKNNGIDIPAKYFDKIIWAGSHDTVIWSVVTGEADVGVAQSRVYDDLLREYPELEDKLFIVSRSAELPPICLVLRQGFPVEVRDRLFFLLTQMDKTDDGKHALAVLGATGFVGAFFPTWCSPAIPRGSTVSSPKTKKS
ncbi:MAG: phosphate/phosphite/phosphonate ABC transporter substrate-binding protein [Deltaproteobacteria bacterium]